MEQQIVLTSNVISYFLSKSVNPFRNDEVKDCICVLDDNSIVDDKHRNIFKKMSQLIDSFEESTKDSNKLYYLKEIFENWLKNSPQLDVAYNNYDDIDFFELCKLTFDKLFFNPLLQSSEINKLSKKHTDLEFHNSTSLIKPELHHRLKNLPLVVNLKEVEFMDLNRLLLPFIRKSATIEIYEPYITGKHNFLNFKKFFEITPISSNITIYVFRSLKKDKDKFEQFNNFVKKSKEKGYKINVEYFESNFDTEHIERYIVTDKYSIYLPGGFNCINSDGFVRIGKDEYKKEIRIDKIDSSS